MKSLTACFAWASLVLSYVAAQDANITLVPAATGFEGDNTAFVYGNPVQVVANDGGAADGGFRSFALSKSAPFKQTVHQKSGRSKIAIPVHDVGGRDVVLNLAAPDSLIRVFDAGSGEKVESNDRKQIGDWSTACVWRSDKSGESYVFLFGKKMVVQLLVRGKENIEILEVCFDSFVRDQGTNSHN